MNNDNVHSIRPQTVDKNKAEILEAADVMIEAGKRILRLAGVKHLELYAIDPDSGTITHTIQMNPSESQP